jgi:hypothetical protein
VSRARHTYESSFWVAAALLGCLFSAVSCQGEGCHRVQTLTPPADTTPFSDGTPVFSLCRTCPVFGTNGTASLCMVSFGDNEPSALVDCFYGLHGTVSIGGPGTTFFSDYPNDFGVCEYFCGTDELHSCTFSAEATGVTMLTCSFGRTCD